MPPSPSLRRSPKEISHKRGHSIGSILPAKSKDDELTLFTEMQKHERDNFLLEPAEDFDESISKLSYFRDLKVGVNIAARRENRDLLNVDGDRNDYDWLLTPPETPLFHSLDDEENQRISLAHRGRSQIKPVSISRSSTMENSRRSNRSSASPSRMSPSPRSCSSTVLTRTRSSNSSSQCSTPLSLQPSTPSQRSSTPSASKTLTPPRRSSSPASRRMCTSSGPMPNGKRGTSPVKANQRSSSPKLQGWQSSDPGFSFDAPPNLRTSLSDRSVSRSRGGSPSSFSGLDLVWRGRRQSVSPTPSRRASSSHSNDRDRLSSYSKSSATSKKPSKSFSSSSAPKRSFDSAVWLMDHRKAPQDMFRPLLSSVPSTTFSAGKGNNVHQPILSHNSSLTTSSNASFKQGAMFGPCMDNDQRRDVVGECEVTTSPVIHDDIFMCDKLDELNEGPNCQQCTLSATRSGPESPSTVKSAENTRQDPAMERGRTAQTSCNVASSTEVGHCIVATCASCGKLFNSMNVGAEVDYCEECALVDEGFKIQVLEEAHRQDQKTINSKPYVISDATCISPDCAESINEATLDSLLVNDEPQGDCQQKCPASQSTVDTTDEMLLGKHVVNAAENIRAHDVGDSSVENSIGTSFPQCSINVCQPTEQTSVIECDILRKQTGDHHNEAPQCQPESICESIECVSDTRTIDYSHKLGSIGHPNVNAENVEGAGISVLLLRKSSSNKGTVVEGRPLAATNILCSEPYYTRDNVSMLKQTNGWDSSSAASSIDQGSSRQSDVHLECLKSRNRYDIEKAKIASTVSCKSISSMSDMSISNCSVSLCAPSDTIAGTGFLTDNSGSSASRTMICTEELDGSCKYTLSSAIECWSAAQAIFNDSSESFGDVVIENQSTGRMAHKDNLSANLCSSDTKTWNDIPLSLASDESCILETEEGTSAITQCYSVGTPEHPNNECGIDNYETQYEAVLASNEAKKLDDCGVPIIFEEDVLVSATETNTMDFPGDGLHNVQATERSHGPRWQALHLCLTSISKKSPVTVEGSKEQIPRCFTLEEATDTVLFCSAIVHDVAYKAATIGLEREQELEFTAIPRSAITIVGNSMPKGEGLRKLPRRRMPKHRKKSEGETSTETSKVEVVTKDPGQARSIPEVTRMPDSMKLPKLESKCNCTVM
ncbi:hypothetical protein ACP70R_019873 [Stipagrostis hirtigluma subsp. patula]